MGLKDLGKLGKKKNRIFLILVIWLLVAFSLFTFTLPGIFEVPLFVGILIFVPLLGLCMVMGFSAIFTKNEISALSTKKYFLYCLLGTGIIIIFSFLSIVLAILGILFFIFITSIFTLWSCYENGVSWDEKIYKWTSPFNHIARWLQYLILPILAGILVGIAAIIGWVWAIVSPNIANIYAIVAWIIIGVCAFIWFVSFWFIFVGKLNSWLGVFFIWVALYTYYLMFKAFISLSLEINPTGSTIGGSYTLLIEIGLYIFDLLVILSVIGRLVGEKSEKLSKTLHMRSETLLVWLIFGKAAFEFIDILPNTNIGTLKAVLGFILFVPLVLITGIYGIINYFKVKKGMKTKKKE